MMLCHNERKDLKKISSLKATLLDSFRNTRGGISPPTCFGSPTSPSTDKNNASQTPRYSTPEVRRSREKKGPAIARGSSGIPSEFQSGITDKVTESG